MGSALCAKKPCNNCPFLKVGGIELRQGRLSQIIAKLIADDFLVFHCHKSVHNERTGGSFDEEGNYTVSHKEAMCAGAAIYLEKVCRPTVGMRYARMLGIYDPALSQQHHTLVIEPEPNKVKPKLNLRVQNES